MAKISEQDLESVTASLPALVDNVAAAEALEVSTRLAWVAADSALTAARSALANAKDAVCVLSSTELTDRALAAEAAAALIENP